MNNNIQVYYSDKNKLAAVLLCFFLGTLGLHRIYIGRKQGGLLMLGLTVVGWLTTGLGIGGALTLAVSIWALVDLVCLCIGKLTDAQGRPLKFGA